MIIQLSLYSALLSSLKGAFLGGQSTINGQKGYNCINRATFLLLRLQLHMNVLVLFLLMTNSTLITNNTRNGTTNIVHTVVVVKHAVICSY